MAALSRMSANIHRKISIKPTDTIIFSSTPVPGNEKQHQRYELSMKGALYIKILTYLDMLVKRK